MINGHKMSKNRYKTSENISKIATNRPNKISPRGVFPCVQPGAHLLIICLCWWPSCLHPDFLRAYAIKVSAYTHLQTTHSTSFAKNICRLRRWIYCLFKSINVCLFTSIEIFFMYLIVQLPLSVL